MSTIEITDAQDGVTCPSCGAMESDSWEWVGTEWEFHCGACGAEHAVKDRQMSITIWLEKEPKSAATTPGERK